MAIFLVAGIIVPTQALRYTSEDILAEAKVSFEMFEPMADSYDDYIITYYNSSYIETVNWQYVQIAGSDEEIKPEFVGLEVVIDELVQTGPTSCIAVVNLP